MRKKREFHHEEVVSVSWILHIWYVTMSVRYL